MQAGTVLGTLIAQEALGEDEANIMMEAAVTATADAGGMFAIEEEEMREEAETAMVVMVETCREQSSKLVSASAARTEAAQHRLALQQAQMLNPQVCWLPVMCFSFCACSPVS